MTGPTRNQLISDFLRQHGWADAAQTPLAGDASGRVYWRLTRDGSHAVLMDCPDAATTPICTPGMSDADRLALGWNATARLAGGRIEAFVCIADWLRAAGLSAPEIYGADAVNGLILVEDLGDDLYARVLHDGSDEMALYDAAFDVLLHVHATPVPARLSAQGLSWDMLRYDALALKAGADLLVDWLPKLHPHLCFDGSARAAWDDLWAGILPALVATPPVMVLRDYHAENILWLPQRTGLNRVGLIDFQDAVLGHPAWDVLMLTQDARRDVNPAVAAHIWARFEAEYGADMRGQAALLGALNAARILGVFARLATRDHKPRYLDFMPRVWAALAENLAHPDAAPLAAWFQAHVPMREIA
jgi:hypothetical protein